LIEEEEKEREITKETHSLHESFGVSVEFVGKIRK
jgi:hypothetical protein